MSENQKNPTPRFTGIFIPVEILQRKDLSFFDKILLSWIDALYDEEHGGCFASNLYLSKELEVKENTIAKAITRLRKLKLIEDISFDGRKRVIRALINKVVDKSQSKSKAALDKNPTSHGQTSNPRMDNRPNSSYSYSKGESKDKYMSQHSLRLANFLFSSILQMNPKKKKPNLDAWAADIDKLMSIDDYTEKEVESVIKWVFEDPFWCKNILSGKKLREKYEQLVMAKAADSKQPKYGGSTVDRRTQNIDGTPVDSPADGLF